MSYYDSRVGMSELVGRTLREVEISEDNDQIRFVCDDGTVFRMYHEQDCCEGVSIEEINGDVQDLVGSPVLYAEESTGCGGFDNEIEDPNWQDAAPTGWQPGEYTESFTWTFYRIGTVKGGVTIRWLGESNGYYSESVDLVKETP